MASTSDDDISELRSYESNDGEEIEEEEFVEEIVGEEEQVEFEESESELELESESEVEESDNDLEVMEILAQTQQHTQNDPQPFPVVNNEVASNTIASGSEKKVSARGKPFHETISKRFCLFIHPG